MHYEETIATSQCSPAPITGYPASQNGTAKVSSLEDIAIFTDTEDLPLSQVFDKIYEKEDGAKAIDHKASSNDLKAYFEEVLPDYDKDRVYISDIKKLINWYNILHELEMLIPGSDEEKEEGDNAEKKAETVAKGKKADDKAETKAKAKSEANSNKKPTVPK